MQSVIFDLDDTLYDRTQPLRKAFLEQVDHPNVSFEHFYRIYQTYSDIAFEQVKDQQMTLEESHIFRISKTLLELGLKISKEDALSFQASYAYYQQQIEPFPFIQEILDFLQDQGVQTCIMTNGPTPNQRKKVKNLGLSCYFKPEEILVSSEEGVAKPDRQIFEIAEQRFRLDKEQTWYIGDSYHHDIVGAASSGWKAIWLNQNNQNPIDSSYQPTKSVSTTLELKEYLMELFQ
ncbi:HAD family hydrolase [Mesobacillus maritimus]|uniref:HAD family hydrolase n=1 Tax=Mesobacillus maritimus TaxID=1643336 RepID=UPI00203AD08D|nr:HAD family hydrolase [Mesobacillus maritimus]MCM3668710.1 HAD family hydrolase [Mesobacillus maritimus]